MYRIDEDVARVEARCAFRAGRQDVLLTVLGEQVPEGEACRAP
jgi:hypothetical protein